MTSNRSSEAFWWSLFSAGGVLSALFVPALVVATGLILPARVRRDPAVADRLVETAALWPVRIVLFAVVLFAFIHCAHRVRHILIDLGMRGAPAPLAAACYGAALVGAAAAGWLLITL